MVSYQSKTLIPEIFVKGPIAVYTFQTSRKVTTPYPFSVKQPDSIPLPPKNNLLAHGAGSPLAGIGLKGLGLGNTLGEDSGIVALHSC